MPGNTVGKLQMEQKGLPQVSPLCSLNNYFSAFIPIAIICVTF
jgi:hypothetical protein